MFVKYLLIDKSIYYPGLLDLIAREDKIANLPESFARQTENYDFLIKEPNPLISRSLNSKRKSSFVENAETSFATKSNFTASVTASLAPLFPSALAFKQKPYKFNKNDSSITTKHSNKLEKFEAKKRSSSLPSKIKTKTVLKKDSNKILVAEKSQLRKLLICLLQLPRLLGEAASFPDDDVGQMFEEFSAKVSKIYSFSINYKMCLRSCEGLLKVILHKLSIFQLIRLNN